MKNCASCKRCILLARPFVQSNGLSAYGVCEKTGKSCISKSMCCKDYEFGSEPDLTPAETAAVMIQALQLCEGFGEKRIRRLCDQSRDVIRDMQGRAFAKAYSPVQLVRAIKEEYGIDLKEIMERNVEKNE